MFFIPGFVISLVTFPGVIVHEFAHLLFCRLMRVPVFQVCYFRIGNPAGFVQHEVPRYKWQHVLISIGPFFVNTIVGAIIAFPAAIPVLKFNDGTPLDYVLIYLGVSIAMHAFPSRGDANSMWSSFKEGKSNIFEKILVAPIMGFIYIGAIGSMVWLDALYGAAVALGLPQLIIKALA
jgi:hypothetical protein